MNGAIRGLVKGSEIALVTTNARIDVDMIAVNGLTNHSTEYALQTTNS
jgi:hypothetical protein